VTTVTTGTKKVDAFRVLFCVLALFSLPSVLTDVGGAADIVLAEAVTEADATAGAGAGRYWHGEGGIRSSQHRDALDTVIH
jgi:hypothetical protein